MSLTFDPKTGEPIHAPKRRDVFEFDDEIASIFENMAVRSIPMYAETHNVHAAITKSYIEKRFRTKQYYVADVGASTGMFIKSLMARYELPKDFVPNNFRAVAIDPSEDMIDRITDQLPWVVGVSMEAQYMDSLNTKFDVVNLSYVLQFIPREEHASTVWAIANSMNDGGLLFVSQKIDISPPFASVFGDEYIRFRKDNGYSDEEIATKTEALKTSMRVDTLDYVKGLLMEYGFWSFQDTTRWMNFGSFACIKRDD